MHCPELSRNDAGCRSRTKVQYPDVSGLDQDVRDAMAAGVKDVLTDVKKASE